ncbi:hypothetical protein BC830DRAFT_1168950 [Chytriomyces sp. MP71]|nr:hypothetical protein BC830DRAFT_1168950 [Chytriomyces sp. MP71]
MAASPLAAGSSSPVSCVPHRVPDKDDKEAALAPVQYAPPPNPPPGFAPALPDHSTLQAAFAVADASMTPPGYFDVSQIPMQKVLMRADVQPPTACSAEVTRTRTDVKTHDAVIASNPDELYKYFLYYLNERPGMFLHVHGSHQETRTVMHQVFSFD